MLLCHCECALKHDYKLLNHTFDCDSHSFLSRFYSLLFHQKNLQFYNF